MRARKQLDVMAAVLALPKGPVRDEMWRLAGRAMENLGYTQLENQVQHNTALQEEYAQAVSLSPTGAPPYARDRVRLSSLITRQLTAENALRERAFELARAEYYGLHGVDPLATLPPWLRDEPEHEPAHEPRAKARGHAATLPREAVANDTTPGDSTPGEQASPQHPPESAGAHGLTAGAQTADESVASMGYVKELARRLRAEGLTHDDGLKLRVETKQQKLTRAQVGQRAIELMMASHRAKSKQPQSAKA